MALPRAIVARTNGATSGASKSFLQQVILYARLHCPAVDCIAINERVHTSASDDGSQPPSPSCAIPSTHPCHRTSHAICKNAHCPLSHIAMQYAAGQRIPCSRHSSETGTPLSACFKIPLSANCCAIACRAMHDLRVAKSSILHPKSPQISCRENSTFEHQ